MCEKRMWFLYFDATLIIMWDAGLCISYNKHDSDKTSKNATGKYIVVLVYIESNWHLKI